MEIIEVKCKNCHTGIYIQNDHVREKMFCTLGCMNSYKTPSPKNGIQLMAFFSGFKMIGPILSIYGDFYLFIYNYKISVLKKRLNKKLWSPIFHRKY